MQGGFTRHAAIHVGDARDGLLLGLVNKSFLQRNAPDRFDMHPLLRQYAAESLERLPVRLASTREQHCAYFFAKLAQWAIDAKGPRQIERWPAISSEVENCSAAWIWAVSQERIDLLLPAYDGLGLLYERLGAFELGERAFQTAGQMSCLADGSRAEGAVQQGIAQAKALTWEMHFADSLGKTEEAIERLDSTQNILGDESIQSASDTELYRARGYLHLSFAHLLRHTERVGRRALCPECHHFRRIERSEGALSGISGPIRHGS